MWSLDTSTNAVHLRLLENKEKQPELWCLQSIKKPLSSLSVYGEKRPEGIWNSCAYLAVVLKELIFGVAVPEKGWKIKYGPKS